MTNPEPRREAQFRADPRGYVLLGSIFGLLVLLGLVGGWKTNSWGVALTAGALLAWFMYWLNRFEITLSDQGLTYRSVWGRRALAWSDIRNSEFQAGIQTNADRSKPMFRLIIRPSGSSADRPLIINLKPFRRDDIQRLLNLPKLRLVK